MAGAALLRSAASRMARAPPRLLVQERLQHHGRRLLEGPGPSNRLSSYSTSSASTTPPTNHRGPQTNNRKVPSEWDWAKAAAKEIAPKVACCVALSSCMFIYFWVNPTLDRIKDSLDADAIERSTMMDEIKRGHQRIHGLLDSEETQIEARDLVGQGKETVGQEAAAALFVWLIQHQSTVFFFQNKSALAISHQPTEQGEMIKMIPEAVQESS